MAKTARIYSNTWQDEWFQNLSIDHKLLWLYIVSNERCNIAGLYDTSIKNISNDTDISRESIISGFKVFAEARKAFYHEGYVIISNRVKYNADNPKIYTGVGNIFAATPKEVIKFIVENGSEYTDENGKIIQEIRILTVIKSYGIDTISYSILFNSIQSNSIPSTSYSKPAEISKPVVSPKKPPKKSGDDPVVVVGWSKDFSDVFSVVSEEYGLSKNDLSKIKKVAGNQEGRNLITKIVKSSERKAEESKRGAYLMAALRKQGQS